jgi:hypothetical protein
MAVCRRIVSTCFACVKATLLQPNPLLQLVLAWATFFMLFPVLPLVFHQQQCWLKCYAGTYSAHDVYIDKYRFLSLMEF